jgi:tetratricopeptide (TPR) repeat protein
MDEGPAPPVARTAIAGQPTGRPFVGRAQELAELTSALEETLRGHGSLVLLAGEPGIGKTRLMSEFSRVAVERDARVVAGRCWEEGGAPPYWPWMQVVRSIGDDFERLAAPLDSQLGGWGASGLVPRDERLRLFDAVGRYLANRSSGRPLLITLDDVHAADEPSLVLLRFLGDALADAAILLVASYREGERRVRELAEVFAELARVGRRLPLRGLTPADIEAYVVTVTGSAPAPRVAARLREITGGNAFFVGEVIRLLAAEGRLERLDETGKDPFLRLPEEVRVLIRRRVSALSREAVALLRVAAVVGSEFDLHVLQRMSRLSPARVLAALGEAATAGIVAALPSTLRRYSFAHELVRETLYDDLPSARRLELHRRVGRVLESAYGDDLDPHLAEIARHLYLAAPLGNAGQALDYLIRAGDRARALLAYEEAIVHYRQALELLPIVGETSGERACELLLRLGDAQWRSGNGAEARRTFEEAIEDARRLGSGELLARAALGYVLALGGFLLYSRFEVGGIGLALLEDALAAQPPGDGSLRAVLLAHLALEMYSANEPVERRVAVSQQAIEMARRVGDSEALVTALHARHWALTTPGMALERLAHTEEMLRVAKETVNPESEFLAHNARFHCFLELSDRRGMDAESQAMTEIAERLRQPFYSWHTLCLRTLQATLDGRFADAERFAEEALELGRLRQSEYATYVFRYAQLLAIRCAQGRLRELWPEIEDHAERFPWIPRWRDALAAAELGDERMARRELDRHAGRDFADLPRDGLWILHLCGLAECCVLAGDKRLALRLYELLLPHADDNAVSYTQQPFGPVALRLGKLAALLGRGREADRHFAAALSRCELLGARAIRARVLLEHASTLAAREEPADSGRLEAMLDEAARLCDELVMPGLSERVEAIRREPSVEQTALFRREGDYWTVSFGGETFRLRELKGLRYIELLLAARGRELHVLELVQAAEGRHAPPVDRGAEEGLSASVPRAPGPALDAEAKEAYRRRLDELDEDLEEARRWADPERVTLIEEEVDALTGELGRAVGLGGRDRELGSPEERARVSVTKAVGTAIKAIDRHCPALARHLTASIKTGRFCSYAPPAQVPPRWTL